MQTGSESIDREASLRDIVWSQVGRVLGMIDLNPASSTFGCCDRTYWHYRTVATSPGASWQQVMMAFSILSNTEPPINTELSPERLRFAALAALRWWCKIQHRDGSVDEWYRNERSYCATAFTTMAAAITVSELGEALPQIEKQEILASLTRAGSWLTTRWNSEVMNQNGAAIAALLVSAQVTGSSHLAEQGRLKLLRLSREQSGDGWFSEYGGADFGYSTLMLDLLSISHRHGGGDDILPIADSLGNWLKPFLSAHPTLPGSIGSRGTCHPFVAGARYFEEIIPDFVGISLRLEEGLNCGWSTGPASVDDRYLAYFYFPQFALAAHPAHGVKSAVSTSTQLPLTLGATGRTGSMFPQFAGRGWTATVSPSMGNALAVALTGEKYSHNLGYELRLKNGQRFSTAYWGPDLETSSNLAVSRSFRKVSSSLPLKRLAVPFYLGTSLLGVQILTEPLKALVRQRLVSPSKTVPVTLRRKISAADDHLLIHDKISGTLSNVNWIGPTAYHTSHSPSARQAHSACLAPPNWDPEEAAIKLSKGQVIDVKWRWPISGDTLV